MVLCSAGATLVLAYKLEISSTCLETRPANGNQPSCSSFERRFVPYQLNWKNLSESYKCGRRGKMDEPNLPLTRGRDEAESGADMVVDGGGGYGLFHHIVGGFVPQYRGEVFGEHAGGMERAPLGRF